MPKHAQHPVQHVPVIPAQATLAILHIYANSCSQECRRYSLVLVSMHASQFTDAAEAFLHVCVCSCTVTMTHRHRHCEFSYCVDFNCILSPSSHKARSKRAHQGLRVCRRVCVCPETRDTSTDQRARHSERTLSLRNSTLWQTCVSSCVCRKALQPCSDLNTT